MLKIRKIGNDGYVASGVTPTAKVGLAFIDRATKNGRVFAVKFGVDEAEEVFREIIETQQKLAKETKGKLTSPPSFMKPNKKNEDEVFISFNFKMNDTELQALEDGQFPSGILFFDIGADQPTKELSLYSDDEVKVAYTCKIYKNKQGIISARFILEGIRLIAKGENSKGGISVSKDDSESAISALAGLDATTAPKPKKEAVTATIEDDEIPF